MSPQPRKARSGRRQFPGGMHGGTSKEWKQVMAHPDVQRALNDPGIQQALYHNLQNTVPGGLGGIVPQQPPPGGPPMQMAEGGETDLSPEQAAERAAATRTPAQAAQMEQVGFNPDTASPGERPIRFADGGLSIQEQIRLLRLEEATATPQRKAEIESTISNLNTAQATPQTQPGGMTLPGGGNVSGSSMSGINQMVNPVSTGNMAGAMGMGALMGLGTTSHQGLSALVGAGTAGLLNYVIRKYGKGAQAQQKKNQQQQTSSNQPAGTGPQSTSPDATTPPAQANQAPSAPNAPKAPTEVPVPEPWHNGWSDTSSGSTGSTTGGSATGSTTTPGVDLPGTSSGSGTIMGSANSPSGSVISHDGGKTWKDLQSGQPYNDTVVNQTPIFPGSSLTNATPQTTAPVAPQDGQLPDPVNLGMMSPSSFDTGASGASADMSGPEEADMGEMMDLGDEDFAKGGRVRKRKRKLAEGGLPVMPSTARRKAVLLRKPPGEAMPVLHTTIVIAAKPKKEKPEKKQDGGVIRPLKPQLLPPLAGPQDHGPRPHGRVQVPRGSGRAIKGKRFGGIY